MDFYYEDIQGILPLFQPLETAIHRHLIPANTGHSPCSTEERELLELPVRLGGLRINYPVSDADNFYSNSEAITKHLVDIIVIQDGTARSHEFCQR